MDLDAIDDEDKEEEADAEEEEEEEEEVICTSPNEEAELDVALCTDHLGRISVAAAPFEAIWCSTSVKKFPPISLKWHPLFKT